MRPYPYPALAAALLVASPASAERFRYRFVPGETVHSRVSAAAASMMGAAGSEMMKMQFRLTSRQAQRVVSVRGGVVTLMVTEVPLSGRMIALGRSQEYRRPPSKTEVKLTERGRFISRKTIGEEEEQEAGPPGLDATDALYGLNFPDRELKPGDSWEDHITVGSAEAPMKVNVRTRYAGRQRMLGRDCARFLTTLRLSLDGSGQAAIQGIPEPTGRVSGTVTTYFDPRAGIDVYASGSVTLLVRADLQQVSPEAPEMVTVMKINVVQSLMGTGKR